MPYYACAQRHGDFNGDGIIDDADFAMFKERYHTYVEEGDTLGGSMDFDKDGYIAIIDMTTFIQLYNGYDPICDIALEKVPEPEEVPTPTNWPLIGLIVIGGIVLLRRRGKK